MIKLSALTLLAFVSALAIASTPAERQGTTTVEHYGAR